MTQLKKAVTRTVPAHLMKQERDIHVTLCPDGTIQFREKGRRTTYEIPMSACMWLGIKAAADEIRKERKLKRAQKRQK